jgi:hypothetical protein
MNLYDVRLALPERSVKVRVSARNIADAKGLAWLQFGSSVQSVIVAPSGI